jgi:hypothetical protein
MANCSECNGTGYDAKKTEEARKRECDPHMRVRCWACVGNGLERPYPDYSRHRLPSAVALAEFIEDFNTGKLK